MRSSEITLNRQNITDENEVAMFVEGIELYEAAARQTESVRNIAELDVRPSQEHPEGDPAAWNQLVSLTQSPDADSSQAAYEKLFQALEPKVKMFARSKIHSSSAVELDDVCQATMERIYSALKRGKYDPENKFMNWVATIAKNCSYSQWRSSPNAKAQRAGRLILPLDMETDSIGDDAGPARSLKERIATANSAEEDAMAADLGNLSQAIKDSGIKTKWQQMLYLYEIEGLSYAEVASELDIPLGSIQSGLHRAKKQLKQTIEAHPDKYL